MKRKAKELQAARVASGKGRNLLSGFGSGQGGSGPSSYPTRQDNTPSIGDTAKPVETSTSKSYPTRYAVKQLFILLHFYHGF